MKQIGDGIPQQNITKILGYSTGIERSFLQSMSDIKVRDMDANDAGEKIKSFINRTLAERKFNYDKDELQFMIVTVIRDILNRPKFSALTISEISQCFYYGVRGEFGEYMGINSVTYYEWLKHYTDVVKPNINKALSNAPKDLIEPKKQSNNIENKEAILLEHMVFVWEDIKANGADYFNDMGNVVYKWLSKKGILPEFTEDEKQLIRQDAQIKYLAHLRVVNNDLYLKSRTIQMVDIQKVMKSLEIGKETIHSKNIDLEAKKIVVRNYFKMVLNDQEMRSAFEYLLKKA